jgi:hypothetical protein
MIPTYFAPSSVQQKSQFFLLCGAPHNRNNWNFAGSDAGCERAAAIYSVVESARRHGLDPLAYLRDLLDRLPTHPQTRMTELLPDRWKPPVTA